MNLVISDTEIKVGFTSKNLKKAGKCKVCKRNLESQEKILMIRPLNSSYQYNTHHTIKICKDCIATLLSKLFAEEIRDGSENFYNKIRSYLVFNSLTKQGGK